MDISSFYFLIPAVCDENLATSLFLNLDTSFLSLVYTFIANFEQLFVHRDTKNKR